MAQADFKPFSAAPAFEEVVMKAETIINLVIRLFIIPFLVFSIAIPPHQAQAQDSGYLDPSGKYSQEELTQMLAPIALYPDALLSQLLMASTYPIEVIEADRWVRKNSGLKDEALDDALLDEDWDPSVKAICHFPSILALMSERITETTNIGNAFLAQEDEVMEMIQQLRSKAYAQGNLTTTSQQKIIVEKETIIIEPANPRVIYVPYYDPFYIYGPWWYPAYPPYYWGPSRVSVGIGISYWPAFYFGFGFGTWSYFDWHLHSILIDIHKRPRYVRHDRWRAEPGRWNHTPRHRRGVAYRDKSTARQYGQSPNRTREFRSATRGFPERTQDRSINDRPVIDRDSRVNNRAKIDKNKQMQQQSTRQIPERTRIEPERQRSQPVERDRQIQQRPGQENLPQERIAGERQAKPRENVFNRVENGRQESQASERGRFSRQGLGNDSSGRGRSGGDNRNRNRQ